MRNERAIGAPEQPIRIEPSDRKPLVLVFHGQKGYAQSLEASLMHSGFESVGVGEEIDAYDLLCGLRPDLLIIDKANYFDAGLRWVRNGKICPTIVLSDGADSKKDTDKAAVLALESGAEDFIRDSNDFSFIANRSKSILSRFSNTQNLIKVSNLEIDLKRKRIQSPEGPITFSNQEWAFLAQLAINKNRIMSIVELKIKAGGLPILPKDAEIVRTNISRIRAQLGEYAGMVETFQGVGYALVSDEERHGRQYRFPSKVEPLDFPTELKPLVLIVDWNEGRHRPLTEMLNDAGFEVKMANSFREYSEKKKGRPPEVVVVRAERADDVRDVKACGSSSIAVVEDRAKAVVEALNMGADFCVRERDTNDVVIFAKKIVRENMGEVKPDDLKLRGGKLDLRSGRAVIGKNKTLLSQGELRLVRSLIEEGGSADFATLTTKTSAGREKDVTSVRTVVFRIRRKIGRDFIISRGGEYHLNV